MVAEVSALGARQHRAVGLRRFLFSPPQPESCRHNGAGDPGSPSNPPGEILAEPKAGRGRGLIKANQLQATLCWGGALLAHWFFPFPRRRPEVGRVT